jgi:predicted RNase H-like nuclease (RuvC/YqgF family)
VFELRRHKLQIMKQIIDTVPDNVKLVRLNEVERSPETFIQDLVRAFDLTVKDGYQPQPNSPITHTTGMFESM